MRRSTVFVLGLLGTPLACQSGAAPPPKAGFEAQAAAAAPAPVPTGPKPELGSFGVDLAAMDTTVNPADDFYGYVNGAWLKTYELKPDEMRYGSFIKLVYRSEDQVKAILDELSQKNAAPGSIGQKIADYFASYMDIEALNKKGIEPLRPELGQIAAISNRDQLVEAFGRSGLMGTTAPISSSVSIDRKDPSRYVLQVAHSGLGLPTREYYLEESFSKVRDAYQQNIAKLLGIAGIAEAEAKTAAAEVLALETAIAEHHLTRAELREVDKTYNPFTVEKLEKEVPGYAWRRDWQAAGVDVASLKQVNVATPTALVPLAKLIKKTPIATWKHYLTYHLVKNHAQLLGDAIDNAAFEFHGKVLSGQQEQRERWKRGVQLVGAHESLGEAIGKLYVEKYFPPSSKQKMDELVKNLRAAFSERLAKLDWMGEQTKQEAFAKLESFNPKIGYPKKWRDFSGIQIARDDLMANYRAVRKYWYDDQLSRLKKPTDKDEWFMSPQTINAYYNPQFNEIVFPAAILQPPFFDPNADSAVNYGAIGAVIGHEMGHGFDDQGSKMDFAGIQRNWWAKADREAFEKRTKELVEQYNQYEPLKDQRVNGQLTLGENIGDLGGLSIAYHAYLMSLEGKEAPIIDGFTGDQRFFLAWAQLWRAKYRDEFLVRILKADPHSPGRYRANGIVRNVDAWYTAFDVGPQAALFLQPEKRVSIW